jgi:hypothetical protein
MHPRDYDQAEANVDTRYDRPQSGTAMGLEAPQTANGRPYEQMEKLAESGRQLREGRRNGALHIAAMFYPGAPIRVLIEAAEEIEKYIYAE